MFDGVGAHPVLFHVEPVFNGPNITHHVVKEYHIGNGHYMIETRRVENGEQIGLHTFWQDITRSR